MTTKLQRATRFCTRTKIIGKDLVASARLVWTASPALTILIVFLSVVLALIPAATLWVGKLLLDQVGRAIMGGHHDPETAYRHLAWLLAVQVAIGALAALVSTTFSAARELLGDTLQNHATLRILGKAASLDIAQFENADTYDALRNAYMEVGTRPLGIVLQMIGVGQALITLGSIGTLLGRLGPHVMPLVLAASIPGVIVSSRFGAINYRMIRRRAPDARVQTYLGSLLTSDTLVKEVRVFGFESYLIDGFERYYRRFRAQFVHLVSQRSAWSTGASLLSACLIGVATLPVLRRAASATVTIGDFSLFTVGIGYVQAQFATLLSNISGMYENLLYMRNLFDFLELPSRDLNAGEEWRGPIERLEFDRVGFRYPLTDRDVLRDSSFAVKRGQMLALVGENGAGKTTAVKLLTRLFEPTQGRILLNGADAARFSPRSVQRQMSIIFQDYGQYQMTTRENIALSRIGAIDKQREIEIAGVMSGADEFIRTLPAGYETVLGRLFPGGRQLSAGQWQRVALARLHFRPASVQILDEPTSALDAAAEAAMIQRLRARGADRITVVISHRMSTARLADVIIVLEAGSVVEAGSHEELIRNGGVYANLFATQARGYENEPPRAPAVSRC